MVAGGYRVEPDQLRAGARGCHELSDAVRASVVEPLASVAGANEGFVSTQAVVVTAAAWEAETGQLVVMLWSAGDRLDDTAAEYQRADLAGADGFQRTLRGG